MRTADVENIPIFDHRVPSSKPRIFNTIFKDKKIKSLYDKKIKNVINVTISMISQKKIIL